jgi:hypothetical protein
MRLLVFILLFSISIVGVSQGNIDKIKELELELVAKLNEARQFKTLKEQHQPVQEFEELLRKMMAYDETFTYEFEELGKLISTIKSPDGAFRIFNWNMEHGDYKEHKYYCLMMKKDPKTGEFIIIELFDHSSDYEYGAEFKALTEKKWFGCLYYDIIPVKKGLKTQYTLLGWDGNDMLSNKKIIETMKFHKKDRLKFGEAMFKSDEEKTKRRVIFEYNEQSVMSLRYQSTKKVCMLIFDHLSPTAPNLEGMHEWYVTDLSFDAYVLENGKWVYVKDVDARTGKKFKSKYNAPDN